jgi:hypothetical protein
MKGLEGRIRPEALGTAPAALGPKREVKGPHVKTEVVPTSVIQAFASHSHCSRTGAIEPVPRARRSSSRPD